MSIIGLHVYYGLSNIAMGGVIAQQYGVGLAIKRSRVRPSSVRGSITSVGKLFTAM